MFKNLKLRSRLLANFGVVLLLTLALSLWSTWQLRSLMNNTDELSGNWLPSVEAGGRIDSALGELRLAYLQLTTAENEARRSAYAADVGKRRKELDSAVKRYLPLISSEAERQWAEQLKQALLRYDQDGDTLSDIFKNGHDAEARRFFGAEMRLHAEELQQAASKIVQLNHEGADAEAGIARRTYARALLSVWAATVAVVCLGLAFAWHIAADLRHRVGRAATAAQKFAAGDLTHEFEISGRDEVADMLGAMSSMRQQLSTLVQGVRQNAESVATASAQISQGNADLSTRTEQQASALQQTAVSMEAINSTARNNAANAAQASQLAIQASGVADEGGRVVDGVVQTMRQIEQASRQVEEIVSVIDGIAYQTNVLALSAAVEAARAGEQGRGFAIVADEVRTLAQRSAEAASQVKQLITTSVERVTSGTALVDQAGSTMREMKSAVQRVSHIVAEIATGSRGQMGGVGQVSAAVTSMDKSTRQNAALVEESSAAVESLGRQAKALVKAVAAFKTDTGTAQRITLATLTASSASWQTTGTPVPGAARPAYAPNDLEWTSF